jgi:hypothetical protein
VVVGKYTYQSCSCWHNRDLQGLVGNNHHSYVDI